MNAVFPVRSARPSVSCVVPAYNEAANLDLLLGALRQQLVALSERWEIVLVDDGSRDTTAAAVAPWLTQPGVRYVQLSRNFGKEAALTAGLDRAEGEVVFLLDADLQHPVEMLPRMLQAWREGADVVCAVRASREDESLVKRLGTRLFYRVVNMQSEVHIPEDVGDFRLMDRRVVQALQALPERNRFMKGLYAWVGFNTRVLPYTPAQRHAGRSSFSLMRLMRLAFTGVTAFSNAPLRLWSGLGALIAMLSLAFGLWIVVDHVFEGHDVPGWATLAVSISFLSGVQLLSVGILGEYIGRIFNEVKRRPLYVVAQEAGRGALGDAAGVPMARGAVPIEAVPAPAARSSSAQAV